MPWRAQPLAVDVLLNDITVLVADRPPTVDPALQGQILAVVGLLLGTPAYPTPPPHERRRARVARAYVHACEAVELASVGYANDPAWALCKQELEHAQNGT
jgi:hypothetical protein